MQDAHIAHSPTRASTQRSVLARSRQRHRRSPGALSFPDDDLGSPLRWPAYDNMLRTPRYRRLPPTSPISVTISRPAGHTSESVGSSSFSCTTTFPGCSTATAWNAANARIGNAAYIDLKSFPAPKFRRSAGKLAPVRSGRAPRCRRPLLRRGFAGFWRADKSSPRLPRDLSRFTADVRKLVASHAPWQLITTFNEWGREPRSSRRDNGRPRAVTASTSTFFTVCWEGPGSPRGPGHEEDGGAEAEAEAEADAQLEAAATETEARRDAGAGDTADEMDRGLRNGGLDTGRGPAGRAVPLARLHVVGRRVRRGREGPDLPCARRRRRPYDPAPRDTTRRRGRRSAGADPGCCARGRSATHYRCR